jgi:ATP-dependent Clp protease ATP-binding subunit ClpA
MARVLQEHIKRPLAEELLFGTLAGGGSVLATVAENGESLALDCRPSKTPELLGQD